MKNIFYIILNVLLGGMMIYGGVMKINSTDTQTPQSIEFNAAYNNNDEVSINETEKFNSQYYFFSTMSEMKPYAGKFWIYLGIAELIGGLLLVSQIFARFGAFVLLPITINIFLFHTVVKQDEILLSIILLAINFVLINRSCKVWKSLLSIDKSILKFKK